MISDEIESNFDAEVVSNAQSLIREKILLHERLFRGGFERAIRKIFERMDIWLELVSKTRTSDLR